MRMISVVCGVVLAAVCGGCLQKEAGQSIYLGPSGVVWSVTCSCSHNPVNMLPCDGRVHGAVAYAPSNTTDSRANWSRLGVVARW